MLHYIEGPNNILVADNLSRLYWLVTPAQIAEGKKLIEPTEVSYEEEDKAYILDQEYSGFYDDEVWECIECYLNLSETHIQIKIRWITLAFVNCSSTACSTSKGVAHTNVGQKLLNCYPLRVFSGDR